MIHDLYDWVKNAFTTPSPEALAFRELDDSKRRLLEAQTAREYADSVCKHEWFSTGAMETGQCRCIKCGVWNTAFNAPAQQEPVTTTCRDSFLSGYEAAQADAKVCDLPPHGWHCTRNAGHDGPCAAVETDDHELVARAMTRLAEQPPVQQEPVAWMHDCAALLTNDVELWIDRCPHCGKPRTSPPAQSSNDERAAVDANKHFNAAIDFAIAQGSEADSFLRHWREGDTEDWPEFNEYLTAKGTAGETK